MALEVKKPPMNARDIRDVDSMSRLGRSPGGGHGNPLQYSCLENPMDRGDWRDVVHRVAKSQTRLKRLSINGCIRENAILYSAVVLQVTLHSKGKCEQKDFDFLEPTFFMTLEFTV